MDQGLKGRICVALAAVAAGMFIGIASVNADPSPPPIDSRVPNGLCLKCHDQKVTAGAGTRQQRTLDPVEIQAFGASAHNGMQCVECHPGQSALPHARQERPGLLNASVSVACAECHRDAYDGYLESPHGTMAKLGYIKGPDCTDCHGKEHSIALVQQWTEKDRLEACANCHSGATNGFLGAIPGHGAASSGFLPTTYFAGIFLMILTTVTLGFGIVHVELETLSWLIHRFVHGRGTGA
jgi:hypothetical protein